MNKNLKKVYRPQLLALVQGDTEEKSCQKRNQVVKQAHLSLDVDTFLFTQSLHDEPLDCKMRYHNLI